MNNKIISMLLNFSKKILPPILFMFCGMIIAAGIGSLFVGGMEGFGFAFILVGLFIIFILNKFNLDFKEKNKKTKQ